MRNKLNLKHNSPFFLSLVFFVYPFIYIFSGDYPFYFLYLPVICIASYIYLVYVKNKYIVFILWTILLSYIFYGTVFMDSHYILFMFYPVNLLVWKFNDDITTYRSISFFTLVTGLMLWIIAKDTEISEKIILFIFYFIAMSSYFLQRKWKLESQIKEERTKHNKHINILLTENERNRISRDLHDSLGHVFVMLNLKAELATKYLDKNLIDEAKNELIEINNISKKSMVEIREIINKLKHRTVSEELKIIEDIMTMANVHCEIENNINIKNINQIHEWTITMILKELTNNVIKHSNATNCTIKLMESENNFEIVCTDNGRGFEKITGNELKSLKERIKVADGIITIKNIKNPTTISTIIPKVKNI